VFDTASVETPLLVLFPLSQHRLQLVKIAFGWMRALPRLSQRARLYYPVIALDAYRQRTPKRGPCSAVF
jgi:hypothetical protein